MPEANLTADRGPWTGGYTSSVDPFMAKPDQLVSTSDNTASTSSKNFAINPITGDLSQRAGCAILNDTIFGGAEVTGLLNKKWSAKCRKLFGIDSPSLTDGYPTLAALYGNDTNDGFPTADVGFPGTIYVNSTNAGLTTAEKNYSLLEEFSLGSTYSTPAISTETGYKLKVVPVWVDSGDGVYNRGSLTGTAGTDKFMQQFLTCGSRGLLGTQNWIYAPNLRATPWRWNKRFNEGSALGSSTVRIYPTGPIPPLWPPQIDTLPAAASGSTWVEGDTFYVSVMFQFEDGSYSQPFIPRAIQASALTTGLGLITVGTISATPTNKYPYVPYKNIPIGPEGTVARILLRTPKQNRTASTDTVTISPLDLRVMGVLRNNTQTTYNDYNGDDGSLLEDADVVRFDLTMPRRARYIGTGDQRAIISYTLPNTGSIIIAPCSQNTNFDRNAADTSDNCYGSSGYYIRITSTDAGQTREIRTMADLAERGDPTRWSSLAESALVLTGLAPSDPNASLAKWLEKVGGGISLTMFSAVPKGSGLGTSSILGAATIQCLDRVLGRERAPHELFAATSALEQMLSTRGGWQDQVGGVHGGFKIARTVAGDAQQPAVEPIVVPAPLLSELRERSLLYFTGERRMAKNILENVVWNWLVRETSAVKAVDRLRANAERMRTSLAAGDLDGVVAQVTEYMKRKRQIDPGSCPKSFDELAGLWKRELSAWCFAGAGGGGFMLLVAKDAKAAEALRARIDGDPPHRRARAFAFEPDPIGLRCAVL